MHIPAAPELLEARIAPATIYALEYGTNKLVAFDSATPGTLTEDVTISGLAAGEVMAGIDYDAATGQLHGVAVHDDGVTRSVHAYAINRTTGAATLYGAGTYSGLADTGNYAVAADPVRDQLLMINDADEQIGLSHNGVSVDFNVDDPNQAEKIAGIAFDHTLGSLVTTLFGYNYDTDQLVRIGGVDGKPNPEFGVVTPIAHVKLNGSNFTATVPAIGFDIASPYGGSDSGWLSIFNGATHLYQMNLATADMTDLGAIGNGTRLFSGLAVSPEAAPPAIAGNKATWTDVDGDLVTLTVSKGTLVAANFRMLTGVQGSALALLTLDASFAGANIRVTAKPGPMGGDGQVNIGAISAVGVDLGNLKIVGDLGRIDAGIAGGAPSVKSLTAHAFGGLGRTLLPGALMNDDSALADGAGKIAIAGDFNGSLDLGHGKTGNISIGGDLTGAGGSRGAIACGLVNGDSVGKVTIKGSLIGGNINVFAPTGSLLLEDVASVVIGGSVVGGADIDSGDIDLYGPGVKTLTVGGSIVGAGGDSSGRVVLAGTVTLKIGGDLAGGAGQFSGIIGKTFDGDFLKRATIGGSIYSSMKYTGINATRIGTLVVKGSVTGSADAPVYLDADGMVGAATQADALAIGRIAIGGNLEHGLIGAGVGAFFSGDNADAAIGRISVGKNVVASSIAAGIAASNGTFGDGDDAFAGGNSGNPAIVAKIASITVGGQIFGTAGGPADSFGIEAEQIGAIKIGRAQLALTAAQDDFFTGFTADVRVREV